MIDIDVVDTSKVTALEIRQQPKHDRVLPEGIDVAQSAGYFDVAPVATLGLGYPQGSETVVATMVDAEGRQGVGGSPVLSLDVGSVEPYGQDPTGGTIFVIARTLGA